VILPAWDAVIALQAVQIAYERANWETMTDTQWDSVRNILAYLSSRLQDAVGPPP